MQTPSCRFSRLPGVLVLAMGLALTVPSCTGDRDTNPANPLLGSAADDDVDAFLRDLGDWPAAPVPPKDPAATTRYFVVKDARNDSYDYRCSVQPRNRVNQFQALKAPGLTNADLKPGAMLQGKSVIAGTPKLLRIGRNPVTLTLNLLLPGGDSTSIVVPVPTTANLQQAVATLVSRIPTTVDVVPAQMSTGVESAYTYSQAIGALGINPKYSTSFDAKFKDSIRVSATSRTVAAYLVQPMFTISFDRGLDYQSAILFDSTVTVAALQKAVAAGQMGEDNIPTYIRSVTYGRMFTFLATADSATSDDDLTASVDATFQDFKTGDSHVTASQRAILSRTHFVTQVFGGTQSAANDAIGSQDYRKFFTTTPATAAVPLSYDIARVVDDDPASTYDAVTYDEMGTCDAPSGYTVRVAWDSVTTTSPLGCAAPKTLLVTAGILAPLTIPSTLRGELLPLTPLLRFSSSMDVKVQDPALYKFRLTSNVIDDVAAEVVTSTNADYTYPFDFLVNNKAKPMTQAVSNLLCTFTFYYRVKKTAQYGGA